ncbi:MAG TPA: helix-hairpin-helix domain-containing protein [Pseudogracilibacillus sp.]|nr:helix-hairpin-helix domain-containing protein [Pseudogracilibacillus sp.]
MLQLFKQYLVAILIGIGLLAFMVYQFLLKENDHMVIENDRMAVESINENVENEKEVMEEQGVDESIIIVDVKGEIVHPGVYEMNVNDRTIDLIEKAGGLTEEADGAAVNFAAKLIDEMVVYVPKIGEEIASNSNLQAGNQSHGSQTDKIAINQATLEELTSLNGIGPQKAQAILNHIEEHGPFQSIEDILKVNGIGEKTLANFEDDIVVP